MTKVAAITMIKDECDVIELFVKINSRSVDHIFILDHNSKDGTLEILMHMKAHGYPLTIFKYDSLDYNQGVMLTTLARQVSASNEYNYIVPLDADEFICTPSGTFAEAVAKEVPPDGVGTIAWNTYVPIHGEYYNAQAPLYEVFRKCRKEPNQIYKVIIPNEVAKVCIIGMGSHQIAINGQAVQGSLVTPVLQHLPVRSIEQITAKALVGAHQISILPGRSKSTGSHWDDLAQKIRANNHRLSRHDMLGLAFNYASDLSQSVDESAVDESAPRVGTAEDRIELQEQARINILRKFDLFTGTLCAEILALRQARDATL